MSARLSKRLSDLKAEGRAGFVPFIMAGDPNVDVSLSILTQLPEHGADIIELGMPFSDPMADGPTIQAAGIRALEANTKLANIFSIIFCIGILIYASMCISRKGRFGDFLNPSPFDDFLYPSPVFPKDFLNFL